MTDWPTVADPGSVAAVAHVAGPGQHAQTHVLDRVEQHLRRFVAYPSEAALVASVLWAAHTHALDCFDNTPRLAYLSPEPGSGKTRALEVLEAVVRNAVLTVNVSVSYLSRRIADEDNRPVVLFDEADTVFGPRASKDNEELRGILNAGYRRGAITGRSVIRGKSVEYEDLPAFCAVALAGLGDLPDTVMTRAVVVRMRRRAPSEHVEPYRRRQHGVEGEMLGEALAEWVRDVEHLLEGAWPDLPEGIVDRNADVWEPLLSVADAAGGHWPARARQAAVELVTAAAERPATLGIRLLADLRTIFDRHGADALPTEVLLDDLHALDESPWADLKGKPLDARGLSRYLSRYRTPDNPMRPVVIRVGDSTPRGYRREDLHDAWSRYLPTPTLSTPSPDPATSATPATPDLWEPDKPAPTADEPEPGPDPSPPEAPDPWAVFSAADVEPEHRGPCVRCGALCRRYGPGAGPLCPVCLEQQVSA